MKINLWITKNPVTYEMDGLLNELNESIEDTNEIVTASSVKTLLENNHEENTKSETERKEFTPLSPDSSVSEINSPEPPKMRKDFTPLVSDSSVSQRTSPEAPKECGVDPFTILSELLEDDLNVAKECNDPLNVFSKMMTRDINVARHFDVMRCNQLELLQVQRELKLKDSTHQKNAEMEITHRIETGYLKNESRKLAEENNSLREENSKLREEIGSLKERVSSLKEEIDTAKIQYSIAEGEISRLEAEVFQAKQRIQCVICKDRYVTLEFWHCSHAVVCSTCYSNMDAPRRCPICQHEGGAHEIYLP